MPFCFGGSEIENQWSKSEAMMSDMGNMFKDLLRSLKEPSTFK